jgi:two-component system cell cycle sensor histidine kinase/response regulator CckA
MKNHHGLVNVYSELGNGSTFNLYLPASGKQVVEEQAQAVSESENSGPITILLVDDEPFIQEIGREILESMGHQVLVAGSGTEAVKKLGENPLAVDLVILDMIMPGMSGGEMLEHLKAIDPDVRVLLSSGYSINGQVQDILDKGCVGFIQKPFTINHLRDKLRKIQNR